MMPTLSIRSVKETLKIRLFNGIKFKDLKLLKL